MNNRQRLGPAPAGGAIARLGAQRAAVLDALRQHGAPTTIAALAAELDVHPNTARGHLDGLVESGLAVRDRAPVTGRGRPAWTYVAVSDAIEPAPGDYAGLAAALAAHIARTSADPMAEALDAGRAWGTQIAAGHRAPRRPGVAGARHAVVAILDELGFDPRADRHATTVALRRCPLLDAARRYPDVVCQVHLGLVRGALETLGGDPEPTELLAFAEPGACRLNLATRG